MEEPQPAAVQDDGASNAQPVVDTQPTAAEPQEPAKQPEQDAAQVDETAEFLAKKGLSKDDPEYADKLLKMAFNSEKLMTKATQKASELEQSLGSQQPQASNNDEIISALWTDKMLNDFRKNNNDHEQYEPTMAKLLLEEIRLPDGTVTNNAQLVHYGVKSLNEIYLMAKGMSPVNTEAVKQGAKQEVLQTLANTQRAGGADAHASQTNPKSAQTDNILEGIRMSRGE